jgi:AraC-like DNA-binding protein
MKARLNTLLMQGDRSFSIKLADHYHALNELHYHQEAELIYIIEGEGTLLIGEQFEQVGKGMLLMIGPNVPHMFKFENHTYLNALMRQGKVDLPLKLLTLHLDPNIMGEKFLLLPENHLINNLLKEALKGISFNTTDNAPLVEAMYRLMHAPIYERLFLLMQLLTMLGSFKAKRLLTTAPDHSAYNESDETRLTKVYLYTLNNFSRNIQLKEVAAMIYMVPNAFCRYFKLRTNKTYFTFLMEVRIRHACKLLKENDYSVVVVGYESGFSNLSNFNRHFKQLTGKTPLEYRNFFRKQVQ